MFWGHCLEILNFQTRGLPFSFSFFLNFIYSWDTQREAETQAEGEAGSLQGNLMWNLIPGPRDHHLSQRQMLKAEPPFHFLLGSADHIAELNLWARTKWVFFWTSHWQFLRETVEEEKQAFRMPRSHCAYRRLELGLGCWVRPLQGAAVFLGQPPSHFSEFFPFLYGVVGPLKQQ